MKTLQEKLDAAQDRANELENKLIRLEQTREVEHQDARIREAKLQSDLQDAERETKLVGERH